jgi:DNA-directed RNA polymerase specialized sigma24 family protein/CheY-like chemotaxis protein
MRPTPDEEAMVQDSPTARAATLAPHLPYVRRLARALTGSQASGDSYASATLEAILQDPTALAEHLDPRAALFRVLIKVWNSVPQEALTAESSPGGPLAAADRNLDAISPLPRAAFLMHSVEGLSLERVAGALDMSLIQATRLIEQAGREIAGQISTDVLIIEDEPLIAMDLEALVTELGHRAVHISRTRADAVNAMREHRPGLVLADIHLADGSSGLDAVNEILAMCDVSVIFITAYPERLLTGEQPEPAFLITKPFRSETVQAVISQALFFDRKAHRSSRSEAAGAG